MVLFYGGSSKLIILVKRKYCVPGYTRRKQRNKWIKEWWSCIFTFTHIISFMLHDKPAVMYPPPSQDCQVHFLENVACQIGQIAPHYLKEKACIPPKGLGRCIDIAKPRNKKQLSQQHTPQPTVSEAWELPPRTRRKFCTYTHHPCC